MGIKGDVGWILPKYRRFLKMLQLWNHLLSLDDNRLTKHIFEWEYVGSLLRYFNVAVIPGFPDARIYGRLPRFGTLVPGA